MINFSSKQSQKQKYSLYGLKITYSKDIPIKDYVTVFESLFSYPPAEIYAIVHYLVINGEFLLSDIPRDMGLALCKKIEKIKKTTKQRVTFSLLTQ